MKCFFEETGEDDMTGWNDPGEDWTEWIRLIRSVEIKIRDQVVEELLSKIRTVNIS